MSGEILIVVWIVFVALVLPQRRYHRRERIDGAVESRYFPLLAIICFLPLIIWAGFRTGAGYADTNAYIKMYQGLPGTLSGLRIYLPLIQKDVGFYVFSGIIKLIFGSNFTPFLMIIALIQGMSMIRFYRRYSSNYIMSIFLFIISAEYLAWMFNGIRQFLAVAIIYLAIPFLLRKNYLRFILVILLSSTIHQTALIMIPITFIVHGNPWNKKTLVLILLALVVLVFTDQFTGFLDIALSSTQYSENVSLMAEQAGVNPLRVAVYSVPAVLAFLGRHQIESAGKEVINVSVNMSVITMTLYLVGMATSGIMMGRLPIYTSLFNYVLLPYEIDNIFAKEDAKFLKIGTVILYFAYYYYLMHFAYGRI